jgi:hypothetical protein
MIEDNSTLALPTPARVLAWTIIEPADIPEQETLSASEKRGETARLNKLL